MARAEITKPVIAVPIGDPNGIGPEIVIKALSEQAACADATPVAIGSAEVLRRHNALMGLGANINEVDLSLSGFLPQAVNVLDIQSPGLDELLIGSVQGAAGLAAFSSIKASCEMALSGKAAAVATAPINKESIKAAGVKFIGHTEMYGALTGTADPLTMFEVRNLRVFFLTRHLSLSDSIKACKKDRIVDYLKRCWEALGNLGIHEGTMAVAGLNPHCGEHGLFGNEEAEEIEPAIKEAKELGLAVEGPIGADSVFALALKGRYNSVLSLYHDQGHIATKTLDFERTISLTLGMPILRASVDHGTALDIAGKGIASSVSMTEAIRLAAKYAPYFRA
ncbi:MAG: 4-hydroxythreonine-4-phosphate dehydrogenase PdxA [Clostridiales bacterium]|jgi:4-hydroxythreonine-4-phosphate dehydrogenase|nr:4-hydroxythreonine-4-phosphate dehydrogenase PdxA [Clostridiales bacterium]